MVSDDQDSVRSGVKRRDALRMLAAAGTAATGSLIVSQPARADTGSEACRYEFSGGGPVATFSAFNTVFGDFFGINMSVAGTCPCGSVSSIEYSYYLDADSNDASTGSGWVGSSAWNAGGIFQALWPGGGGTFTVTAGVRVTCTGPAGATIRCRYATSPSIAIGGGFFSSVNGQTLTLGTNNGDSGSGVLPVCNPPAAPLAAGRLFSNAAAGGALMMQPGPLVLPEEVRRLEAGEVPTDPLGNPLDPVDPEQAEPAESATETPGRTPIVEDTPSSTTTSTTSPASTTSTTSTTTTTSTSSTTSTTSTTTPPTGSTPPATPTGP